MQFRAMNQRKNGTQKAGRRDYKRDGQGLTARERMFCERYCVHWNRYRAYLEAFGVETRGGDWREQRNTESVEKVRKTYARIAAIMRRPSVSEFLAAIMQDERRYTELLRGAVDNELSSAGLTRITDVAQWTEDGLTLIPSSEIEPSAAAAVQAIETTEHTDKDGNKRRNVKVKMIDKNAALANLMKRHGLMKQPEVGESLIFTATVRSAY